MVTNCPLCAGVLIVARLVSTGSSWVLAANDGKQPTTKNTSDLLARTCSQCGFVLFFAQHPERIVKR